MAHLHPAAIETLDMLAEMLEGTSWPEDRHAAVEAFLKAAKEEGIVTPQEYMRLRSAPSPPRCSVFLSRFLSMCLGHFDRPRDPFIYCCRTGRVAISSRAAAFRLRRTKGERDA